MQKVEWVKLNIDMFSNHKIRALRKLPEGNNIVLIWVALLTLAGRCNAGGMIFLTENIPYSTKTLADELEFEENTVKLAIEALKSFGMISTDNFLCISGWEEHQNEAKLSAIREYNRDAKRKSRELQKEKQKIVLCGSVNDMSLTCPGQSEPPSISLSISEESNSLLTEKKEIGVQGEEEEEKPKPDPTSKKKPAEDPFKTFAGDDAELLEALVEYEKMRDKKKKPLSERAKTLLINKLRDKFPANQWIEIIDQSTLRNWDSFYPLKDDDDWGGASSGRNKKTGSGNVFFDLARELAANEQIGV